MLDKLHGHFRCLRNAQRLAVPYHRRRGFAMPAEITIGEKKIPLVYPQEAGTGFIFLECLIDDVYGLAELEPQVAKVADIGANLGFFSLAARSYLPEADIHAYEPNLRTFRYLSANGDAADITVFQEAVGGQEGMVGLEDPDETGHARTSSAISSGGGVHQVTLATVAERLGGRIDLAKIDCEGAEWQLFADPAPWSRIQEVRMEYHLWGGHSFEEVARFFVSVGFDIIRHEPGPEIGVVWCRNPNYAG